MESTVGTSADGLSVVIVSDERHNRRLYAPLQWTTILVSKQQWSHQRSTAVYNQTLEGNSNPAAAGDTYSDSSGALFSMYLSRAENYDKERAESWKANADGILIFVRPRFRFISCALQLNVSQTGLFSAIVAAFVIEGLKNLQPDTGTYSVDLLSQISQQLAAFTNESQSSVVLTFPNRSPFHAPTSALLTSTLWLLSLIVSLSCALLATLLQQWARRFLLITQSRGSKPHDRARIRSFFAEGVIKFHLPKVVDALPALLHISVFFFLAGLLVYIYNIHHTLFFLILPPILLCGIAYSVLTLMPIAHHSSPYRTPFSSLAWSCCMRILRMVKRISGYSFLIRNRDQSVIWSKVTSPPSEPLGYSEYKLERSMARHFEASAKKQNWTMDARALAWTLDALDEDHELEQFAAGLPGLFVSKAVEQPAGMLASILESTTLHPNLGKDIQKLVTGSAPHAESLHLLSKARRLWRDRVCLKALYFIPNAIQVALSHAIRGPGNIVTTPSFLDSYESWAVADALSQDPRIDMKIRLDAECVAAITCARLDPSDQRTPPILANRLAMPIDELTHYLQTHERDNLFLAQLLGFVRRICHIGLGMGYIIDPYLTARTLKLILGREQTGDWTISAPPDLYRSFHQTWDNLSTAEANLRGTTAVGGEGAFSSYDYNRALRNISIMRGFLQPVYDSFKLNFSTSLELAIHNVVASTSDEHSVPLVSASSSPRSELLSRTHNTTD